ncbi:MAG: hypothetical protein F4Y91_13345 [Gemmatimonadetes bacterium]|nr:hypothetical protein [Gemmatimonadota bacterium]MXY83008.1 hypothetical protein [Gemmatimonadota bacterium]MYB71392.1 hypothetical protein [Gemmatimonadota bacterium]
MSSAFNADDNNIPFFGLRVRPQAELCFSPDHSEGHVSGRIDDGEPTPVPSRRRVGNQLIAMSLDMAAKAAFALAFRASGLSRP